MVNLVQTKRRFEVLRLSLTHRCNYNCVYCTVPGEKPQASSYEFNELWNRVLRLHKENPFRKIRITGGEPTLDANLLRWISSIRSLGIDEIHMTTNGISLKTMALALKKAGLKGVNVSVDALNSEIYKKITGSGAMERVLEGLDAAVDAGLSVKINTVMLRGLNETEVLPLLEFGIRKNIPVRYLEFMGSEKNPQWFLSSKDVLAKICSVYNPLPLGRNGNDTAEYYQIENYRFGIIANYSKPFCDTCDRLRMDSRGNLYGCIGSKIPLQINSNSISGVLREAMGQKADRFSGIGPAMREIGG